MKKNLGKIIKKSKGGKRNKRRKKWVYFFGEGTKDMKNLLGGKGANLSEMFKMRIPVPPGFTITTEACIEYYNRRRKYPDGLKEEVRRNLKKLERTADKKFGDPNNPLLLSVRSGARISMPGMMDTVLNLGLNRDTIEGLSALTNNPRFVWDSYRRFIQMFGNVVMDMEHGSFEHILSKIKRKYRIKLDIELTEEMLRELVDNYLSFIRRKTKKEFPQDPEEQLWMSINAVFESWNTNRARAYRRINRIPDDLGTAVNVQTMVFGNVGNDSATGVLFTRNPATGERKLYGEYLINAQGEDVVAGLRTPKQIDEMRRDIPHVYREIVKITERIEKHYTDVQDMEFTVERGKLYMLQTRTGKRTAMAAIKIAVDMVKEGLITKEEAVMRVVPEQLEQMLHKMIDPNAKLNIIAKGLPASPGAAVGKVVFSARRAHALKKKGQRVILVRPETSPEDIEGMDASQGILTSRGGMTSHAAIVARGMGKCCVVGCEQISIDENKKLFRVGDTVVREGKLISLNGTTGEVILGRAPVIDPELKGEFRVLMKWADSFRRLGVRANADTPKDALIAKGFGAEGIGLCRTEHMFFGADRISAVRQMIMSKTEKQRRKALKKLEPMQRKDFVEIFRVMGGLPVTIRFIDPPLHEFLPHGDKELRKLAKRMRLKLSEIKQVVKSLHEMNPMLGHRGCRLVITYPEIAEMQTRAIIGAACSLKKRGIKVQPEIMIPLVGHVNEIRILKDRIKKTAKGVMKRYKVKLDYSIGTMIEVPRACVTADRIAEDAEFFSFGTNDLTQMTFGFSRDDIAKFLPDYLEQGVLEHDPFAILDNSGVGELVKIGVELGRKTNPNLKIGICGEHGGDPESIEFCHYAGLDYVSCSPYRVPVARLSAARVAIEEKNRK